MEHCKPLVLSLLMEGTKEHLIKLIDVLKDKYPSTEYIFDISSKEESYLKVKY